MLDKSKHASAARNGRNMRRALVLAPVIAVGGCTTTDMDLFDLALQLYEVSAYLDGDCPYGQSTYYDTWNGRYSCGYGVKDGDRDGRPRRGGGHDRDDHDGDGGRRDSDGRRDHHDGD